MNKKKILDHYLKKCIVQPCYLEREDCHSILTEVCLGNRMLKKAYQGSQPERLKLWPDTALHLTIVIRKK